MTLVDFHDSNINNINYILKPMRAFFVKNLLHIEIIPEKNEIFFISNKQGIVEKYWELGSFSNHFTARLEHIKINNRYYVYIWPPNTSNHFVAMLKTLDMTNGFTLIQKTTSLIKFWCFSNDDDNINYGRLADLITNEPNIFYHFIEYFNKEAKDLFNKKLYFTIPSTFKLPKNILEEHREELVEKIDLFKKNTIVERYYLNENTYITLRELECLHQLYLGKTYKEIGKTLKVSSNTIRQHIDSVKLKTNIVCKYKLIDTLVKTDLFVNLNV